MTNSSLNTQFLRDIDQVFPHHSFYRMKYSHKKQKYGPPLVTDRSEVAKFNAEGQENCIFFTPNGDCNLYGGKRDKNRTSNVYCLVVDRDDEEKFWEGFEHEPSIIVRTSRGHHTYWLLKEPMKNDKNWYETGKGLARLFGGDAVFDSSRIFRLPGSRYWKDGVGIIITEVIKYEPSIRYGLEDFGKYVLKAREIDSTNKSAKNTSGYSNVVDEINTFCNVADVLEKVSGGKRRVNGIHITEDGAETHGYKYWKQVNALTNFSKNKDYRPEGGPFAVAKKVLGNTPATFKWFQETYGLGSIVREKEETQFKEEKIVDGEVLYEEITVNSMLIKIDYENCETVAYIYDEKNGVEKEVKLLTCAAKPIGYYFKDDMNYYIIYYKKKNDEGYIKFFELGKTNKLQHEFSRMGITVYAMGKAGKILVEYFQNVDKRIDYIDKLGVYDNCTIHKAGSYIENIDGKDFYIDLGQNGFNNKTVFEFNDEATDLDVEMTIYGYAKMYAPNISLTAFTWYAMSILSYKIRQEIGYFPILNFVGLTQSGKTTVRRALMQSFGISKELETQAGTTEFAMMYNCTHYLPLNVAEFEGRDSMRVNRDMFIKNNYDGAKNMRGTSGQHIIFYENNAPLCIDGEVRSMNNAVYSRCISLFMNPRNKGELFDITDTISNYFVKNKAKLNNIKKVYNEVRKQTGEYFAFVKRPEKERIIDNYSLLIAFAQCFDFPDIVKESILKQCEGQFEMMSEDNVDKTIKLVLGTAIQQQLFVYIEEKEQVLCVEFFVDVLKFNANKVEEIKSQIQIVNHHFFGGGSKSNMSGDMLKVPLKHFLENKNLHILFNKTLEHMIKNIKHIESIAIASIIYDYAKEYGFDQQRFAVDISSKFNLQNNNGVFQKTYTDI